MSVLTAYQHCCTAQQSQARSARFGKTTGVQTHLNIFRLLSELNNIVGVRHEKQRLVCEYTEE